MSSRSVRLQIRSEPDAMRPVMEATRRARQIGFGPQEAQAISTAVSELARNILKYASTGEVIIEETQSGRRKGLQITARDRGPGIADVESAMRDHFSSGGTLGLGLPGVKRMMDEFEIDSAPGRGTRVVIRKWLGPHGDLGRSRLREALKRSGEGRTGGQISSGALTSGETKAAAGVDCAFFIRPCRGERVSGDAAVIEQREGFIFAALIDALGHGPSAHRIAVQGAAYLKESWTSDVLATLHGLHDALRGTEGAAAGLCVLEVATSTVRYAGVGNTVIRSFGSREERLYSAAGTLGHQMRTPKEQRLVVTPGDVLMLYSDGIKERFELDDYPQLRYQKSRTIAKTVVERFGKDHDDAGCVILRIES